MPHTCPYCGGEVPEASVSPDRTLAGCPHCRRLLWRAEVMEGFRTDRVDLAQPPPGAWFQRRADGFEAGASSRRGFAFLVFFALVFMAAMTGLAWSLAVSPQSHLIFRAIACVVALGPTGMTLVAGLHLVLMLWGRVTVSVRGSEGTLFTGVGTLGRRRRFRWDRTTLIEERLICRNNVVNPQILIHADRCLQVGIVGFAQERQDYLLAALRRMLQERTPPGAVKTNAPVDARHQPPS